MEKKQHRRAYRFATGGAVVLFCAVIVLGYLTFQTAKQKMEEQDRQLGRLGVKIGALEKRLEKLAASMSASVREAEEPVSQAVAGPGPAFSSREKEKVHAKYQEELREVKDIIESTGLDRLSAKDDIDPEILKRIYSEYAEQYSVWDQRQSLIERNAEQHRLDGDLYEDDLNDLYRRARLRRGEDPENEERKTAFTEMIERFPDAYATAMVVSERAFSAMRSRDVKSVEAYYSMLQDSQNENDVEIVTDRGIEAMPNIELYLTRQYLRDGREEEAGILMESLSSRYADSLVFSGRRGGRFGWTTVAEALTRMADEK